MLRYLQLLAGQEPVCLGGTEESSHHRGTKAEIPGLSLVANREALGLARSCKSYALKDLKAYQGSWMRTQEQSRRHGSMTGVLQELDRASLCRSLNQSCTCSLTAMLRSRHSKSQGPFERQARYATENALLPSALWQSLQYV